MRKLTTEVFIFKARKVHDNKYDYSKTLYLGAFIRVVIICGEHGEFQQRPADHLSGSGCPKCTKVYKYTNEEFIQKAKVIHLNKYRLLEFNYKQLKELSKEQFEELVIRSIK